MKEAIERALAKEGKKLVKLTPTEVIERSTIGEGRDRWRVTHVADDGVHGHQGGKYYHTLIQVAEAVLQETR